MNTLPACQAPDRRLISLQSTGLIAQCLTERGLPVEPLLAGTGIALEDLVHPARLITPAQEQQVFANAARLSGSRLTALKLGQRMRISAYGQLGFAMLSSATLGHAIQVMLSHPNMLGSYFRLSAESYDGATTALCASDYRQAPELHLFNLELCLSSIKAMLDDVLGHPLPLQAVHLNVPGPIHADRFTEFFGDCPVLSEQPCSALVFSKGWMAAPLPLADAVTHWEALEQCRLLEARFTRAGSPLVEKVIAELRQNLDAPPQLEDLAARFHCTSRTLRRHLNQSGQGYQQLLDELRSEKAKTLLAQKNVPVAHIAEQLGFSEPASFRHAFKRWTGLSPRTWRQRQYPANFCPA